MNLFKKSFSSSKSLLKICLKDVPYPIYLRKKSSDIKVYNDIFKKHEYRIVYKPSPNVIIDCGANIGLTSVYLANKYPKAKIIAIEPEKSNFEMLKLNTKKYVNIKAINAGIWNKNAKLMVQDFNIGHHGFVTKEANNSNTTVNSITIGQLMQDFDIEEIDILKIDIEGSEKELFKEGYEDWLSKTRFIIIELHDRLNQGAAKSFFKAICNYNFDFWIRGELCLCKMQI